MLWSVLPPPVLCSIQWLPSTEVKTTSSSETAFPTVTNLLFPKATLVRYRSGPRLAGTHSTPFVELRIAAKPAWKSLVLKPIPTATSVPLPEVIDSSWKAAPRIAVFQLNPSSEVTIVLRPEIGDMQCCPTPT